MNQRVEVPRECDAEDIGQAESVFLPLVVDTMDWLPIFLADNGDSLFPVVGESNLGGYLTDDALSLEHFSDSVAPNSPHDLLLDDGEACSSKSSRVRLNAATKKSESAAATTLHSGWPPKRSTPKQRLALLREEVERLTLELTALKAAAGLDLTAPVARVPATATGSVDFASVDASNLQLWQKLASRQLKHRENAESENKALRQAIALHFRRAKDLRQLLVKLTDDENSRHFAQAMHPQLTLCSCQISRKVFPTCLADDESVFESLGVGMDQLFVGISDVVWQAEMSEITSPGRAWSTSRTSLDSWTIEFRDVNVLPFDYRQTARSVWRLETCQDSQSSSNEIKRSFQLPYVHSTGTLKIQQRRLVRRHHTADSTVLVIRQLSQPLPELTVDATTQLVIKRGPASVSSPTTVMETRFKSTVYATASAQQISFGILPEARPQATREGDMFAVSLWDGWMSRTHESLESLLIAESAKGAVEAR